jgi:hypothetical protein
MQREQFFNQMKTSFRFLIVISICVNFSNPLVARDKSPGAISGFPFTQKTRDTTIQSKDTGSVKKDTVKKAASDADSTAPTPSHFQTNITYQSNNVNNGRKDSSVIPLVTPEISYVFKSGFEIDLDVGYNIHEPSPQVNQYTLDGSYTFNPGNYSGTVTLSGFIYNKLSGSTTAEEKGSLEYANSYSFSFIQPSVNFTWTFGNHIPDYQISPALQQQFNIGNLSITPTITMNAATQNAYNSYYQNRRFSIPRNDGKPPLPENVTITGEVLNASKFQILDYELSSPISYTAGNWTFSFTPTYAMPVNPADIKATITTDRITKSYTYKETLPNTFYWSVEVLYAFK